MVSEKFEKISKLKLLSTFQLAALLAVVFIAAVQSILKVEFSASSC